MTELTNKSLRIIIVDDDDDTRLVLSTMLYSMGHKPRAFACGRELLEVVGEVSADLLLLDLMLPEMDGLQLLKVLRTFPTFAGLPVFLVTANSIDELTLQKAPGGAELFFTKPFGKTQLSEGLRLLASRQVASLSGITEVSSPGVTPLGQQC